MGGYREVTDDLKSNRGEFLQKRHETRNGRCGKECGSNEGGRKKWGYVKVTMDGFVVGRKVCVLDHGGHSTLAHQLEDMFGKVLMRSFSTFLSIFRIFYSSWDSKISCNVPNRLIWD